MDSLLYVDTDILFLHPVEQIWNFLSKFNSTHMAAMAPEHEEPRIAWYNRFARHPYYGKTGVNSGVMLMNMTRIRAKRFKVEKRVCMFCVCGCIRSFVNDIKEASFVFYDTSKMRTRILMLGQQRSLLFC